MAAECYAEICNKDISATPGVFKRDQVTMETLINCVLHIPCHLVERGVAGWQEHAAAEPGGHQRGAGTVQRPLQVLL